MFRWFKALHYPNTSKRDLRIDWLRGFALFVMIVDHVVSDSSWFYSITGRAHFYISAAEGFYFISGLTLGILATNQGLQKSLVYVVQRTWVLYRTTVLICLGFVLANYVGLEVWYDDWDKSQNLLEFVAGAITLYNDYNGSGILALYVFFMLLTPLALLFIFQGRTWGVLLASLMTYTFSQIYPQIVETPISTLFFEGAWQILFFVGLVIGFHRQTLSRFWAQRPFARDVLGGLILVLAALFVFVRVKGLWPGLDALVVGSQPQQQLIWPRLLLVALYLQAFYILITWFWRPIHKATGWLLVPLGSASLWTFTWHLLIMLPLYNLLDYAAVTSNIWAGTAFHMLALLTIWSSIVLYRRWRNKALHAA
ncbi:MAG: OpgC domain-containing protein [Meiothermus sp.]|uniref:OpgC domain-containing protein n=1 Tax=Meiothermus sp. TaxID=1955249 RepID=UPI00298EEB0C|nr:OpgC domain-containing protein [Meiothermus sp.]MDW8425826.1 OpgC domain-containing protein [Meiothermus sp.]